MGPLAHAQALSAAFSGGFWLGLAAGMAGLYIAAVVIRWWRERA